MLVDGWSRTVRYLRLSVTPDCPMRCLYCRPLSVAPRAAADPLRPEEIEALVRHLVERHGLRKVRVTGGEPLARADILDIVARLGRIEGLADLAMTTNGLRLANMAANLAAAGLRRVNVSLDSLDPTRFRRITGCDGLDRVVAGIDAARHAGLGPIRLNAVVLAGANDDELYALVDFAQRHDAEMRFIELMPMGPMAGQWAERFVGQEEMKRRLAEQTFDWRPVAEQGGAARRWRLRLADGRQATVGLISAMSCPFCDSCDRLRIASDGAVYGCLMGLPGGNLMPALRPAFDGAGVDEVLHGVLRGKQREHGQSGVATMVQVGG